MLDMEKRNNAQLGKPALQALEENLPFWKSLEEDQRSTLLNASAQFWYPKGALLHHNRAECTGLVMVLEGRLRIYTVSDTGKEITLYRLFERDICILSASCLIRNITFDVHVQAETDTMVLRIATDAYQKIAAMNSKVQDFTNQLVSSRFSDVMWVVEQVVFMSIDRRLAMHLLEAASMAGSETFSTTHDAIARDLGTAREVVTRMLNRFQDEKLVAVGRGFITLVNRDGLYKLT
ncbi:MAG: Crp/Fnr family transcriptional regulator [Sphaerochaetaceae bacterium]|jgi:CRP/FNR family transcriptional regulator|nr:Crp/Fnr family transcriptional regulator [Sphaerochaetaceae bacterium]